jgi:hypothetical protein
MKRAVFAVIAALVTCAASGAAGAGTSFPRLDELAALVSGGPANVRCAHVDEWAVDPFASDTGIRGYTRWTAGGPQYAVLSPRACIGVLLLVLDPVGDTASALNGGLPTLSLTASGLHVLAHEAGHLSGLRDETDAECAGLRAVPAILATLRVPRGRAQRLTTEIALLHRGLPPEYQRHPC